MHYLMACCHDGSQNHFSTTLGISGGSVRIIYKLPHNNRMHLQFVQSASIPPRAINGSQRMQWGGPSPTIWTGAPSLCIVPLVFFTPLTGACDKDHIFVNPTFVTNHNSIQNSTFSIRSSPVPAQFHLHLFLVRLKNFWCHLRTNFSHS